ncbi:MAG TPA: pyridoxamine 5'-phosphate oxidase family protein [Acidimicrobiales bacterium]
MATWGRFATEAPQMAAAGRALWEKHQVMYLATVRADGSPRVHPVVPVLAGDAVFVAVGPWSPKWRDLRRDPRCVLHALPGARDDEFLMRCRAHEVPGARERVRAEAGHAIHADDHVFELAIEQVDHGWWEHVGQPTTYPIRRRWTPGDGVRELQVGRGG